MENSNKLIFEKVKKIMIDDYINDNATLSNLIKPTVGIRKNDQKKISKFGGNPFFSNEFDVKKHVDDLVFLCQILVDEFTPYDEYNYLSNGNILYFFINPNLSYPIQKKDFKVLCLPYRKDSLEEFNDNELLKYNELFVEFFPHYNFPSYQSYERVNIEDENFELDEKIEEIQDFINDFNDIPSGSGSQLFGNPQALQGTVSFHWAIKSLGLSYQFSDDLLKNIRDEEEKYLLLLQIDFSDMKITEDFGDGVFYFGIKKEDLINYNFDNVELIYQST